MLHNNCVTMHLGLTETLTRDKKKKKACTVGLSLLLGSPDEEPCSRSGDGSLGVVLESPTSPDRLL